MGKMILGRKVEVFRNTDIALLENDINKFLKDEIPVGFRVAFMNSFIKGSEIYVVIMIEQKG